MIDKLRCLCYNFFGYKIVKEKEMNFQKLKDTLDELVRVEHTPGVDCIVYKEHEQIFRYFTGYRDVENKIKTDGNELYLIFSMTKLITCIAALQLLEQGKYSLSDNISKFLPEFDKMKITKDALKDKSDQIATGASAGEAIESVNDGYAENKITVEHLLTMTAGLDYNLQAEYIKKAVDGGKTSTREIVGAISETVLGFEPGSRFRYSLCHDVLGALIEVWSGMKLGEYMKKHIFEPLNMNDTFFGVPEDGTRLSRMAARYKFNRDGIPERLPFSNEFLLSSEYESGGAGLVSSTEDYAVLADAIANGGKAKNGVRILKEETVKLMASNHLTGQAYDDFERPRKGYGYGFGVRVLLNPEISESNAPAGEFGWDGAAGGIFMIDPVNKISLTYFQEAQSWKRKIQFMLTNALYESLKD